MMIDFFMRMENVPTTTHQEKQVRVIKGKPVFYEPQELKAARAKLMAYLAPHRPPGKLAGPLRLMVKWCFMATGKHKNGEYRTTKPDVTNLNKLLEDCMTDLGFWEDDCLVVCSIIEKFWAEVPGIYIRVEELEP